MENRFLSRMLLVLSLHLATFSGSAWAEQPLGDANKRPLVSEKVTDFARDIRPILLRSCIRCHGDEKQKGNYRLDVREIALTKGDSFAPNIVTGKSADSPLIRFVSGVGELRMPPEGNLLSEDEIGLLRSWIDQGAHWPDELAGSVKDPRDLWSLKSLVRPAVPFAEESGEKGAAIDAFILKKLQDHQLSPSPEAESWALIRRVYFDLIGLPPSPDEVDRFVNDANPMAYESLVDQLLNSPQYGERWARHWLDAAHFAETHGHDQDRIRENAWPYRDYLIKAFNADTPYGEFIKQQIAGDVLFPEEPSATAALGFLAAGPWDESSLRDIREDSIDRQIARYLDRDDMLSTVINNISSLTVQCARCHDHKFDPIRQRDYFALQAVFAGVERANRKYDLDPEVYRKRMGLMKRKNDLLQRRPAVLAELLTPQIQQMTATWERNRAESIPQWKTLEIKTSMSAHGATLTTLADGSILASGIRPDKDIVTLVSVDFAKSADKKIVDKREPVGSVEPSMSDVMAIVPQRMTAIRLDVLTDESLPRNGPGRNENGNFHLSEFEVYVDDCKVPEAIGNTTADFDQTGWEITKSIDQNEASAWGIDPQEGFPHHAIFELKVPLCTVNSSESENPGSRRVSQLRLVLKQLHGRSHLIGRMKISVTDAKTPIQADHYPEDVRIALSVAPVNRSDEHRIELARFVQLNQIESSLSELPKLSTVYAAAADFEPDGSMKPPPGPRTVHLLRRGDIHQPLEEIGPGAIDCIPQLSARFEVPMDAPESARRVALARWLTDTRNPLTWRSIVNRIWHHHFGRGLVGTLNDFGHMGETPTHPELLDWLATEFRDGGQSFKKLHRMIMTSKTYRQCVDSRAVRSSGSSPMNLTEDPRIVVDVDNRLLWRMNRTRLDAESVRDSVLSFSGRLDLRMGGPSDRQFELKPGIHVTPNVDYTKFDPNSDLGRRRSIYRFLFRTLPDPFMESLDCPSGDQIASARASSITVQQALALWNDAFIAAQCEHISKRIQNDIVRRTSSADGESVQYAEAEFAVRLILGRNPSIEEMGDLTQYVEKHGLANLCRLLVNSNEFLFVN